jgi:hypothetical protein
MGKILFQGRVTCPWVRFDLGIGIDSGFHKRTSSLALFFFVITFPYMRLTSLPLRSMAKTTSFFLLFFRPRTPSSCQPTTVSSTSALPVIPHLGQA